MKARMTWACLEKHKAIQGVERDFWSETENTNRLRSYPTRLGIMAISILSLSAVPTSANCRLTVTCTASSLSALSQSPPRARKPCQERAHVGDRLR